MGKVRKARTEKTGSDLNKESAIFLDHRPHLMEFLIPQQTPDKIVINNFFFFNLKWSILHRIFRS